MKPINSIQFFIDAGYHTVPLNGKCITREPKLLENGSPNPSAGKKKGYSFPQNWKKEYSNKLNDVATPIGLCLTGKGNDLVAIDCDCNASWELFRSIDPDNTAYFESVGKLDSNGNEIVCGTILYAYADHLPPNKSLKGKYDMDWLNGVNGFFLPTEANETKTSWLEDEDGTIVNQEGQPVDIKPMPEIVQKVLELTIEASEVPVVKKVADTAISPRARGYLGKVLDYKHIKKLIAEDQYDPNITRLLTPRDYRSKLYHQQNHLHPNDIDGSGHEYMFKIMCHLAGDNTVDEDLALITIKYINSLWDNPIPAKKLHSTIIDGIISGRQVNPQGDPYWTYDENWETLRNWSYIAKRVQHLHEIFYDDLRMTHYDYNIDEELITEIPKKSDLVNHVSASSMHRFKASEAYLDMANVSTVVDPREDFGYLEDDTKFNLFKPTKALRILSDPALHEQDYKKPTEFINYMENFIPDAQQRGYILSLLRTKLTTFDYSPVIPYIIGVQGSGKGVFMSVIENIIGSQYVSKDVQGKNFISDFNKGFLENKYFVNLNELSEGLNTAQERQKAQGDLKNYTGSTTFQCHGKGSNVYTAEMKAMFILTANHNPLDIEDGDRRVYYVSTPNKFNESPQCKAVNDTKQIHNAIMRQTDDIAYWMATEIQNLSNDDYLTAPHHNGRGKMIFDGKYPAEKLAWALKHKEFLLIEEGFTEPYIFGDRGIDRVYLKDLVACLESTFRNADPEKDLKKAMKAEGFVAHRGTKNSIYYIVPGIKVYTPTIVVEDDEPPLNNESIRVEDLIDE